MQSRNLMMLVARRVFVVLVFLASLLILLVIFPVAAALLFSLSKVEAAAWVQSIGSILAIVSAIWIAGGERRHRAKIDRKARQDAISRAIDVSEYARKIIHNTHEILTVTNLPRSELPRFISFLENAMARVKSTVASPGLDNEIAGYIYEIESALVDVDGIAKQAQTPIFLSGVNNAHFIPGSLKRVDEAIEGLHGIKT
ncbi:hypothetical protein [Pseudomonas coronafaciens]|uniref:hypothetical protein n=1 Tax=Pseudomonas coronafaciens TaxID=53409 RepID=UPI000EFE5247|nr:hypothetical protein [Pseudomonas coronafaciens]